MTISLNGHSSIKLAGALTVYFDPFRIPADTHDADLVFITHGHYDHYSPEDIRKVVREDTVIVLPEGVSCEFPNAVYLTPGSVSTILGVTVETVPAYNIGKKFHPRENGWLGYVVTLEGRRFYVAGDTDVTPEAEKVVCDTAFLPVGGTYTMTADEAARLAETLAPSLVIPTHYGSIVGSKADGKRFASLLPGLSVELKI